MVAMSALGWFLVGSMAGGYFGVVLCALLTSASRNWAE
jgi:hypothetical protein